MKTVFIINPAAGQGKNTDKLILNIQSTSRRLGLDTGIYITEGVSDAERYVRQFCETKGAARFIACGGDGTLNEVLNGAMNCPDAEIGVYPIGTGNDFCRNFSEKNSYFDIEAQLLGQAEKCDVIKYSVGEKTGYCINMVNIGFDCNVAALAAEFKKKPLVSGSFAYFLSILYNLIKKKGANLEIEVDGEIKHSGKLLLTSIANGKSCGGGIKSNPLAEVNDGKLDMNIVKNVSRRKFVSLLPKYMKGTMLSVKNIEKILLSLKCEKVKITSLDENLKLCIDGEIYDGNVVELEIFYRGVNFAPPLKKSIDKSEVKEYNIIK